MTSFLSSFANFSDVLRKHQKFKVVGSNFQGSRTFLRGPFQEMSNRIGWLKRGKSPRIFFPIHSISWKCGQHDKSHHLKIESNLDNIHGSALFARLGRVATREQVGLERDFTLVFIRLLSAADSCSALEGEKCRLLFISFSLPALSCFAAIEQPSDDPTYILP